MSSFRDPNSMRPFERLKEMARLLATGLLRLSSCPSAFLHSAQHLLSAANLKPYGRNPCRLN